MNPARYRPNSVEIHCRPDPTFVKRFGPKLKRASGTYSAARGHSTTRFVKLPIDGNKTLISDIIEGYGSGVVIARDTGLPSGAPSWVSVIQVDGARGRDRDHYKRFITSYYRKVEEAMTRGILPKPLSDATLPPIDEVVLPGTKTLKVSLQMSRPHNSDHFKLRIKDAEGRKQLAAIVIEPQAFVDLMSAHESGNTCEATIWTQAVRAVVGEDTSE